GGSPGTAARQRLWGGAPRRPPHARGRREQGQAGRHQSATVRWQTWHILHGHIGRQLGSRSWTSDLSQRHWGDAWSHFTPFLRFLYALFTVLFTVPLLLSVRVVS